MLKKHNIFASKDIILLAGDLCTCLSPSEDYSPQRLLFSVLQYKFSGEGDVERALAHGGCLWSVQRRGQLCAVSGARGVAALGEVLF